MPPTQGETEGVIDADVVAPTEELAEAVVEALPLAHTLSERESVTDALADLEAAAVTVELKLRLGVTLAGMEAEVLVERVGDSDGEGEAEGDGEREGVLLAEHVIEPEVLCEALRDGDRVAAGEAVSLPLALSDGESEALLLLVAVIEALELLVAEKEALALLVSEKEALALRVGETVLLSLREGETVLLSLREGETVLLSLREGETVRLSLRVATTLAEEDAVSLSVAGSDALGDIEGLADGVALDVVLGVPSQMQKPSVGAPQERRQQSAGQDVLEGEAVALGDCVGAVCEGVGVTQVQTMSGKLPTQT